MIFLDPRIFLGSEKIKFFLLFFCEVDEDVKGGDEGGRGEEVIFFLRKPSFLLSPYS